MKRVVALIVILVALCGAAVGQNIALCERTPRVKHIKWLKEHVPPRQAFTYVEFIHSKSVPCRLSLERIAEEAKGIENLNIIVITKESEEEIDGWLEPFASGASGVVLMGEHCFERFGVEYAPFGVLIGPRRRAVWFGNPQRLSNEQIKNLTKQQSCRSQK